MHISQRSRPGADQRRERVVVRRGPAWKPRFRQLLLADEHGLGLAFEVDVGFAADVDGDRFMVPPVNRWGGVPG